MTPTPTQALEPCPHDGHEAKFERQQFDHPPKHWVKCSYCGASTDVYSSPDSARRAWNQRHRQSSNAASVGVDVVSSFEQLRDLADDTLMEAGAVRYSAGDIEKVQDALIDMGSIARDALDALASLSTPTAEPTPVGQEYDGDALREAREFVEIVAKMPCETAGIEDMEGGCCAPCRARRALSDRSIEARAALSDRPQAEGEVNRG